MQQGMIHLYVGDGKGKTTAAVGLCVRMAGTGGRVVFAQFLKDARSHEREILARLPEVTLVPVPERVKFTARMTPEERAGAAAFWAQTLETAFALAQDAALLVLDEALDAARKGFFPKERLLRLLGARPRGLEVVVTGHAPDPALLAAADYVTIMKNGKHPYEKGVCARAGIEF